MWGSGQTREGVGCMVVVTHVRRRGVSSSGHTHVFPSVSGHTRERGGVWGNYHTHDMGKQPVSTNPNLELSVCALTCTTDPYRASAGDKSRINKKLLDFQASCNM